MAPGRKVSHDSIYIKAVFLAGAADFIHFKQFRWIKISLSHGSLRPSRGEILYCH